MSTVSMKTVDNYKWGNNCYCWHLTASENLSVIQERVLNRLSEIRHFHNKAEQFFYILFGITTFEVSGDINVLHPNKGFLIPAGVAHTLSNEHEQDLEFLVVSTPPSHRDRENA